VNIDQVLPNHVKSSWYLSFCLGIATLFYYFFASIAYCHGVTHQSRFWAHKSCCHSPIISVILTIGIKASSANSAPLYYLLQAGQVNLLRLILGLIISNEACSGMLFKQPLVLCDIVYIEGKEENDL